VIRGALEIESGSSDNTAVVIRKALLDILRENWSFIIFDTCYNAESSVYSFIPYLQYQNKWVLGLRTTTADCREKERMKSFLDTVWDRGRSM
jgi:superfamily II DNA or RNA helicase